MHGNWMAPKEVSNQFRDHPRIADLLFLTCMTTWEYLHTGDDAQWYLLKLLWLMNLANLIRMTRTASAKAAANHTFPPEDVNSLGPVVNRTHHIGISKNVESVSGATACHVDSIARFKEANFAFEVASHSAEYDYLGFFALKIVYCDNPKHTRQVHKRL